MRPPLVALLGALALLGSACAGGGDGAAGSASPPTLEATTTSAPPVATTRAAIGAGQPFVPWLLRDGRLSPGAPRLATTDDGPREALEALIAGRTPVEADLGLQTGVAPSVRVQSIEREGDTITVGFNRAFETVQTRPQVAQVVYTLTQFPGIERVRFLIDGRPNGATGVPPQGRADVADVAPPVLLDEPTPGASRPGPTVELLGSHTAGAVVTWRIEDAFGAILAAGGADRTAPAPGPDGRTAWQATAGLPAGTAGVVRLVVADGSAGVDGFAQVVRLEVGGR